MQITTLLLSLAGISAGIVVGLSFGLIQDAARRRHQRLQNDGKLTQGWAVMPSSMRRVAYLMVALALVQILCPMIFNSGFQWWVSAGVVVGYGFALVRQLKQRLAQAR